MHFSQLLVAPVSVALRDHSYNAHEESPLWLPQPQIAVTCMSLTESTISENFTPLGFTKDSLNVTAEERKYIEVITRDQSQSAQWHMVRCRRTTGSTCGKILMQHEPIPALSCTLSQTLTTTTTTNKMGTES